MKRFLLLVGLVWVACGTQDVTRPHKPRLAADGMEVFSRVFTDSTGLGPLFNGNSCAECHEVPVPGGSGDEVERHTFCSARVLHEFPEPEDAGGEVVILRASPDLFGLGLLDSLTDDAIRTRVEGEPFFLGFLDGRYWFNTPRLRVLSDGRLGRFGRKCQAASLGDFVGGAFQIELGVIPGVEVPPEDVDAATAFVGGLGRPSVGKVGVVDPGGGGQDWGAGPHIFAVLGDPCDGCPLTILAEPVHLPRAVGFPNSGRGFHPVHPEHPAHPAHPPTPSDSVSVGREVFHAIGCAVCHAPETSYTDLALHSLEDVETNCSDTDVGLTEFRTEPLAGLGLQSRFMHDGQSPTLLDAIARHAGEGGFSRANFNHLTDREQLSLFAFLRSL